MLGDTFNDEVFAAHIMRFFQNPEVHKKQKTDLKGENIPKDPLPEKSCTFFQLN